MRKKIILLTTQLAAVLGWLYCFAGPNSAVLFLQCPFYKMTGCYCPGCGSQRAIRELTHLDFLEAIKHNALLCLFFPVGTGLYLFSKKRVANWKTNPRWMWVVFGVVLLFGVLRNLQQFHFLAP